MQLEKPLPVPVTAWQRANNPWSISRGVAVSHSTAVTAGDEGGCQALSLVVLFGGRGTVGSQNLSYKCQTSHPGPGGETRASCLMNCLLHGAEAVRNVGNGVKLLLPEVLQRDKGRAGGSPAHWSSTSLV